jgi:hypothetical protein
MCFTSLHFTRNYQCYLKCFVAYKSFFYPRMSLFWLKNLSRCYKLPIYFIWIFLFLTMTFSTCSCTITWQDFYLQFYFPSLHVICYNPSPRFVTKVRAYRAVSQKWSSGITFHAPRSVGECEEMNPHIPKWAPILGVGALMDSQIFKGQ